jgi:hypothetical protein
MKYIQYNYTREAYTALCYCAPYYKRNPTHELVYKYIEQHIIVDYYHNRKCLTDDVIELMDKLKNTPELIKIIKHNENNIKFYENKHLIKLD